MKLDDFPTRKEYTYTIDILFGAGKSSICLSFRFREATIGKYIKYLQEKNKDEYFLNFVEKKSDILEKIPETKNRKILSAVCNMFFQEHASKIFEIYFFGNHDVEHLDLGKADLGFDISSSYLFYDMQDVFKETIYFILKTYTISQYKFLSEGRAFGKYIETEEGRKKIKKASILRELDKKGIDYI